MIKRLNVTRKLIKNVERATKIHIQDSSSTPHYNDSLSYTLKWIEQVNITIFPNICK